MGVSVSSVELPAGIGRFQKDQFIFFQDKRHGPDIILDADDEKILPGPGGIFQNIEIPTGKDFLGDLLERYSPD